MADGADRSTEADRIRAAYERRRTTVDTSRYSLTRPANALAIQERQGILTSAFAKRGISGFRLLEVLEVGCGSGTELALFVSQGADPNRLHGIDLLGQAVAAARILIPGADIVVGDASTVPYPDDSFDLVYQAMALSSMPSPGMRSQVAAEMRRVVRPGGVIVSYDFAWNPTNRDTVGISRRELRRLFPGLRMELHRVTLIPPMGRWLGDRSVRALRVVAAIPPLRSHRLAIFDVPR